MARRFRTYRYELGPTAAQSIALARAAGARRFVFNWALQEWRDRYEAGGESPTRAELCRALTELKHRPGDEGMLEISSKLMQQAITDVWRACRNFFAGRSRYPRFKSKKRDQARFRYPAGARISTGRIFLPRIGWIRLRYSRQLVGRLKSVTVTRSAGRWYVLALAEFTIADDPVVLRDPSRVIGIDLGITRLATFSDGVAIGPPRFAIREENRIRRATRMLHRKQRGSRNRAKQRRRLSRLHARVAARRRDFLHKLTSSVATTYGGFCVETLDVRELARTKLSKAVLDAGLGEFLRQLEYKADWKRKPFVAVGRFYPSTKTCGECGAVNDALTRSDRTWSCICGAIHDRDLNAAGNIRREGLRLIVAAGHADTSNACGAQVRPPMEAQGAEAGTPRGDAKPVQLRSSALASQRTS